MGTTVNQFGQIVDDGMDNSPANYNWYDANEATATMPSPDNDFASTYRAATTENVFDPTYGGQYTPVANPNVNNGGIGNILSSVFGGANGVKTAAIAAGALAGGLGGTSPNKNRSGYQGSIPQLQAVRNMVTAPPSASTGYRPGQGGVNYNSDVFYAPKGILPDNFNGTMSPAAAVAAANAAKAAAAAKAAPVSKPSSTLSTLAKVAAGTGIASLLTKVLGGNTNLTGLVDKAGNLTQAGLNTLLTKIAGPGGVINKPPIGSVVPKTGGPTGGSPKTGGPSGVPASGDNTSGEETTDGELTTPAGEYAGEDEFSGIDEQVAANENALETPNVLTDEEIANEIANAGGAYDDSVANLDALNGDTTFNWDEDMSSGLDGIDTSGIDTSGIDMSGYDMSGTDFGDYDLSGYDLGSYDMSGLGDDYTLDWAKGGVIKMAKGRYLQGNTDGMADKLPARIGRDQPAALSHGEFVVPADVVSHLGNGNSDAGAKKLYQMMDKIRVARTGNKEQGKKINPDKFMPGGLAQAYANGGSVKKFVDGGATGVSGLATAANAGITGSETAPNTFAGDYIANMLGKTQALTESPYQQYMGPLTAGASGLQNKVFTGLENTAFPTNLGQTFSSTGAYQAPTMGANGTTPSTPMQSQGIASQYMNPYLQSVLDPQMAELRRQSQLNLQPNMAKLTQAGGYGGGRQAIMESEANRNLLQEQNKTIGAGYANAYDKAQQQFNVEQGQAKTLADMIAQQGGTQRGIEAEGIAADKASFEAARQNPYNMLQFQQSMLQGMPISATSYDIAEPSKLVSAAQGAVTVNSLLQNLGLIPKTTP